MPRGRYPARIATPPLDPLVRARYRLNWTGPLLYRHPELLPPLTSQHLFGSTAPLALDLGCGTGEFLCGLAARQPGICYLGVDSAGKPLDRAAWHAATRGLTNVRFLQADALLLAPRLRAGSLRAVYLRFPPPFRTTRKRKLHTYAPAVLAHLRDALAPGGRLSVVTDDAEVLREIERFATPDARLQALPAHEWHLALDEGLKSPYHRRWESLGRTIWRSEFARVPSSDAASA